MKIWQKIILAFVLMFVVIGATIKFTEIPVEAHSPLYWYGGTGNWSSGAAHWSTNSGNVPASTHVSPTSTDSVIFDANSFTAGGQTMTIDATANCLSMTWTTVTNTPTIAGSSALNIYGSLALGTMNITYSGDITFKSTGAGNTITSAGKELSSNITFNGAGGSWSLVDALHTNGSIKTLTMTNGTLDTNGQTVTVSSFAAAAGTSTLTLGATIWNCEQDWTATNLGTLNANTSTIIFSSIGSDFTGAGKAYHDISFVFPAYGTYTSNAPFIKDAISCQDLTITNTNKQDTIVLEADITVAGTFTATGLAANNRLMVRGSGGSTRNITAAVTSVSHTDFMYIGGAGAGDWDLSSAGEDTVDFGNNTGITFTFPYSTSCDLYWTGLMNDAFGGGGEWVEPYNWSTTSGGVAGAPRYWWPTATNSVYFDVNSGFHIGNSTITIFQEKFFFGSAWTPTFATNDLDFTGCGAIVSPTMTWGAYAELGAFYMDVYGDFTEIGGMSWSTVTYNNDSVRFKGTGNITTAGVNFGRSTSVIIDCSGTYILQDDLYIGCISNSITHFTYTSGTLNTNSKTIYLTGITDQTFAGGGKTYYGLVSTTIGTLTITGSNNFTNFTRQGSAVFTDMLKFAADQYITNLVLAGYNGAYRLLFGSTVAGTQRQISVSGTVNVTNTNISDSAKVGAGDPDISAGNNSDFGGNLGWIFTTGINIYWVGNSGSWSDLTNHWSSTSGGAPGTGRIPLIQDTAVFDANSFAIAGRTVTIDITDISGIDASAVTNTPTITKAGTIDIYGDVNLGTVTYTVTTTNFKGLETTLESDSTLTTAFYVLKNEGFMSSLYLNSAVTISGTVCVQSGVFNHNGFNLTATAYDSATNTYNRQIILGAGITTLDGTAAITKWNMNATKLTLTAGESTIKLTSSGANAQTFAGASLTYNNITVAGAGAYTLTFSGTNTAGTMTFDRSGANKTIAGNVTWTLTDPSGLVMDLSGVRTITITNTDFSMASGVVLGDYLVISGSSAAGGATFFANVGGHSTDSGGNAGWVWAPPTAPTIQTNNASDVTYLGQRLNGQLLTAGSYVTFYCYFEYGPTVAYGFTTVPEHTLVAAGVFDNYLSPYKTYHYRAVVRFGLNDHAYGNDKQVSLSGAVGQAKAAVADPGAGAGVSLVSAAPAQPGNMYTEGHTSGLFGLGAIIDPALTAANIPVAVFWYPVAFFIAILLGFLAYGWTRTIIVQAIVSAVTMAAFAGGGALGDGLLPYWTVLVFVIEAAMIFVIQEKQNA